MRSPRLFQLGTCGVAYALLTKVAGISAPGRGNADAAQRPYSARAALCFLLTCFESASGLFQPVAKHKPQIAWLGAGPTAESSAHFSKLLRPSEPQYHRLACDRGSLPRFAIPPGIPLSRAPSTNNPSTRNH